MQTNAIIITVRDSLNCCSLGLGIRVKLSRLLSRYNSVPEAPIVMFNGFLYAVMKIWFLHLILIRTYWSWIVSVPIHQIEEKLALIHPPSNRSGVL